MSDRRGYCVHGKYVGGMGRDILCGRCEVGADYRILGLPKWEVRTYDGRLVQARRKFENLTTLNLMEKYPDIFHLILTEEAVWATREEALEALGEGYTVISPWTGKVQPSMVDRILNIVKFHDSALYVKLQDYVRERV